MKRALMLCALLLCAPLSACASGDGQPAPPSIAYGRDLCESCSMLIDEARFAAATVELGGKAHKFDCIDEMLVFHMDRPNLQVQAYFVHDYGTQNWIRAEKARFVQSPDIRAPMGKGIAAFGDQQAAESYAASLKAQIMSWDELRAYVHVTGHGG
ncbi:MAG: nitrous oxide reductase accessory protein NosL [Chloroflexi bacterium]|nr:nitrous oxide reductase accessory protein NosL [Chloroflexota bacterium]